MPWKTILTLLSLVALLRVPDLIPYYTGYRVFDWAMIPQTLDFQARRASGDPIAEEQAGPRPDLEDLEGAPARQLFGSPDRFFEALHQLESGQARRVRVLHYGDSPTTADMITADVRQLLQKRFGDAGHGYHLVAQPWAWYEHRGVSVSAEGWKIDPANQSTIRDGLYGLGGVSFRGTEGAVSRFTFRNPQRAVEVDRVAGDGELSTKQLSETIWEMRVVSGTVRVFGATFTNGNPGVLYDSLGLNGAYISVLAKMFSAKAWAAELQHAKPDMVVINYGTNESMYANFVDYALEKELRETIRRIRSAVPEASILVMSPMDRGVRSSTGEITTVPALHRLVSIEQRVAADTDVAFFNTFEAMGGTGTMGRWYRAEPRLVNADFIHPMPAGARIVGNLLYNALMDGYQRYKTKVLQEKQHGVAK